MTTMRPILVHVPSGRWADLQIDAERLGVSASRLVRDAIDHHFLSGQMVNLAVESNGQQRVPISGIVKGVQ